LAGGALLAGAAASAGNFGGLRWADFGGATFWALSYLVIAGSVIGYSAYIWLLARVSAVRVASYALVNPVVALALGWAWAGERISGAAWAGSGVILAALALVLARQASPIPAKMGRPLKESR
ncbi:MAG: EamA family transporter, partial [Terriglobales bacterium]